MLALIGPGSSRRLYLVLRRAGLANLITMSFQIWFVGSTILATALFARSLTKKSDVGLEKLARPTTFDWVLLLMWWTVLVFLCLYAFMMGLGG
jgi:hypothetical protein